MKYLSSMIICTILVCSPVLRSQSVLTLSDDDVKFLNDWPGVRQDESR